MNDTNDLKEYIYSIYESDMHDIDDLSEIIEIINNEILNKENSKDFYEKHLQLFKIREFTKKLLVSKARQGHDFYYTDSFPKCQKGELPRRFINIEECKSQHNEFIKYIWKPSTLLLASKHII